ncbi:50S ribosomal protein L11 methyltransferase [Devosia neptuniae]|uniref:50S ribosomal protein L11 methyltransferase n=1 Tax=Devosia neptuniae TaxID=191302 RepID=A0ABY6CKP9_9HYPH|nr:50S ribosomal protein L11 methyltransferase [Devosia neptuniae]UXN71751.1 50S ribosomal protein L11 methyltransferase [Devosia neptuniae]
MIDRNAAIARYLRLEPVPTLPDIRLYTAHPGSRLSQFAGDENDPPAPYWAYQWAGGLALAQHFRAHPDVVAGRRVLDLGAGSGLVGIVAAKLGARASAAEIDPNGRAAIALNAAANDVALPLIDIDISSAPPQNIDLIAAGDVFYNAEIAGLMLPFLVRCAEAGIAVLIGDPDRRDLPHQSLTRLASYPVGDVGDQRSSTDRTGSVYAIK